MTLALVLTEGEALKMFNVGMREAVAIFFCYERLKVSGFVLISHLDKATFKTKESLGPHNLSIA